MNDHGQRENAHFIGRFDEIADSFAQLCHDPKVNDAYRLMFALRNRVAELEARLGKAEARVAEVRARCQEARQIADLITDAGGRPVKASPLIDAILAITGTGEEAHDGR